VRDSVGQLKLVTPLEALKLFSEQLTVLKDLDCQVLSTLNSKVIDHHLNSLHRLLRAVVDEEVGDCGLSVNDKLSDQFIEIVPLTTELIYEVLSVVQGPEFILVIAPRHYVWLAIKHDIPEFSFLRFHKGSCTYAELVEERLLDP
jgi:hypothetical protein